MRKKLYNAIDNSTTYNIVMIITIIISMIPLVFKESTKLFDVIDLITSIIFIIDYVLRLIHEKTGRFSNDKYFWNEAPNSRNVRKKSDYIKKNGKWGLVRDKYLELKNMYLRRNDYNHPSFICYIEAVNTIYDRLR